MNGFTPKRRKISHGADEGDFERGNLPSTSDAVQTRTHPAKALIFNRKSIRPTRSSLRSTSDPVALTGGLNKTSVLGLQVEDLLTELTPTNAPAELPSILAEIETVVKQNPHHEYQSASIASKSMRKKHGVNIPWARELPENDTSYKFTFKPIESFRVVEHKYKSLPDEADGFRVSITVTMPSEMFQDKDYRNYRALNKRAFYIACIAANLKHHVGDKYRIRFVCKDGIRSIPVLSLSSKATDSHHSSGQIWRIALDVEFPIGVIPVEKTLPSRNCVRTPRIQGTDETQPPTPFYNSVIRGQAVASTIDDMIAKAGQKCSSFTPACQLGQLWCQKRGFSSVVTDGGFGYLEWATVSALLLHQGGHRGTPLFSERYNTVQLFKAMLQVLANRDLLDPWLIGTSSYKLEPTNSPVLLDTSLGFNILFKMSPWSYQNLRRHAQVSLSVINSKDQDSFDSTFTINVAESLLQFDEIVHLDIPESSSALRTSGDRDHMNHLHSILKRGLDDRVISIDIRTPSVPEWKINQEPIDKIQIVEVCLITNPDTKSRLIDHGPSAEDHEAGADFRRFWGSKAELRRFKDGSISESLVWSESTSESTILQIIRHLLGLHFQLSEDSIKSKLTDTLPQQFLDSDTKSDVSTAFKLISTTYQSLSSTLHQLDGLPLPIRSISPIHPALRSSSLNHPLKPETVEPVDIVIQFDSSGRWPESLPAIQYTKIAFLQKLGELLSEQKTEITTRVGLENVDTISTGHFNTCFLDIVYPSPSPGTMTPICFRARIHHEREMQLLQMGINDKSLHGSTRDTMSTALSRYKQNYLAKPIHTTTIQSLCTRYVLLENTIRLLKQWMASHLLLHHVPEETLEILAAQVFLKPAPWSAPGSASTAFLRCLFLLSRWDWIVTPLVVDLSLSEDMPAAAYEEIQTRFLAWRKLDPSLNNVVWMVGTNIDPTGTIWTQQNRPPQVIASRISALAGAAIAMVGGNESLVSSVEWTTLFTSPLEDFDFLIHLHSKVVRNAVFSSDGEKLNGSRRRDLVESQFKNLQVQREMDISNIGYNPAVLFLAELESSFGSAAVFFYDPSGGTVITGLWRPNVQGIREWRVRLSYSTIPVASPALKNGIASSETGDEAQVLSQINKNGILAEIAMIGGGIVKRITTKAAS